MKEILIEIRRDGEDDAPQAELDLPANAWEVEDALDRARIKDGQDFAITIRRMPHFPKELLAPHASLDELNFLANRLSRMNDLQRTKLEGLARIENSHQNSMMPVESIIIWTPAASKGT